MDKSQFLVNFGKRMRQAREKKNLSLFDLSVITGISKRQLVHIEHGTSNTTIYYLKLISEALDVPADQLMNE